MTDPGTAVFTGIGGPVTNDLRLFYTVDRLPTRRRSIPTTCPGCTLNVYANLQGGGANDVGYFAVHRGARRSRPVCLVCVYHADGGADHFQGALFNLRSLLTTLQFGNWNNLTVDPTNTVAPVVGGPGKTCWRR